MHKGESAISAAVAAVILLIFLAIQQRWQLATFSDMASSATEYVLATTGFRGQVPELAGFEKVKTYRLGNYQGALYRASPAPLVFAPGRFVIYDRNANPVFKIETLEGSREPWTAVYDFAGRNGLTPPGSRKPNYGFDLTGARVPDAIIAQYSGGDHCCTIATIVELGKESVRVLGRLTGLDGLPFEGLEVRKIDKNLPWALIAHQPYRTACGGHDEAADVLFIYGYVNGQYIDQTANFVAYLKGVLQRDRQKWERGKERSVELLQSIAAMYARLGERDEGKRQFAMGLGSIVPLLRQKGADPNACLDDATDLIDRLPSVATLSQ